MKRSAASLAVLFLMVFALLTWGLHAAIVRVGAFGADFWTMWLGARAMFVERISPYTEQVTQASQQGIYGRSARAGEDQVRFSYPLPALFALWPVAYLPYAWAQATWMAFNLSALMITALWAFPRLPLWAFATLLAFYPLTRDLILGQFSLTVAWLLWWVWWLWKRNRPSLDGWMGFGLAFLMSKPQSAGLWALLWLAMAVRERRWRVLSHFVVGGLVWAGGAMLWVPNWPGQWVHQALAYWNSNPYPGVLQRAAEAAHLERGGTIALALLLLALWGWGLRLWWRHRLDDVPMMAITALIGTLLSPQSLPTDHVLYLLPLLVWLEEAPGRRGLLVWFGGLLAYWMVFFAFFDGKEPLMVGLGLPLLFGGWVLWVIRQGWHPVGA